MYIDCRSLKFRLLQAGPKNEYRKEPSDTSIVVFQSPIACGVLVLLLVFPILTMTKEMRKTIL